MNENFLPIGLSFSCGFSRKVKHENHVKKHLTFQKRNGDLRVLRGNSISFNLYLVDIGAVVSYRFTDDEAEGLPKEVNFNQIFAPGFSVGVGIPRTPLILNAGYQQNPRLRTFEEDNALNSAKFFINISMDIPLYNIFYKTKKERKFYSL